MKWLLEFLGFRKPQKQREVLLWVGDGMSPADDSLLGKDVDFDGRKGRVVETSPLTITVEWDN